MERIINKLMLEFTQGVDTYTHSNSTWLIFTETKQWVIELTENKTLWYNYNFFKNVFAYASLDCVQNQHLITKWVEDNIINKVSDTHFRDARDRKQQFEDTLENGVKYTKMAHMKTDWSVEDTIENGVKHTDILESRRTDSVEDTLQNGVKETYNYSGFRTSSINGAIENGVKETKSDDFNVSQFLCEEVIDKGVKETNHVDVMKFFDNKMEDTIQNGVNETKSAIGKYFEEVQDVLDNGVIEIKGTPGWTGTDKKISNVIDNGVRMTSHLDCREYTGDIDEVLDNGVRNSHPLIYRTKDMIDKVIDNGVKETHREICEYKETIEYIIQTGVKETHDDVYHHKGRIDGVIKNGVKETKSDDFNLGQNMVDKVIKEGTKNPTD